ncbi:MAG: ABC transporter ATP-binding protein [Bacillota bacterium]|nr:ABC transporter ATP-binding protein [Bacillota bacterium]MDI7249117.1 ABC transporter ATP-binding protein [Bacillota bacterium]
MLEVKNLNVSYGQSWVLFDINVVFPANEVSVIVGRNGAGKTTLLKTIAGFLKPRSGTVSFEGRDITGLRPYRIVRMGVKYIPQDKEVFSDLTVRENLELAGYATRDRDWKKVLHYFPKLEELMKRKGAHLSGGERQMLMIGRALLGKTAVLLLDEPTEGLAPTTVQDLVGALKQLRQNSGLVLVEQNLAVARELADRIYLMKEGKIVAQITDRHEIENLTFEREL